MLVTGERTSLIYDDLQQLQLSHTCTVEAVCFTFTTRDIMAFIAQSNAIHVILVKCFQHEMKYV